MIRIDDQYLSLLDFLPPSIASDSEVIALSLALDPELREVGQAMIEAIILPRIDELDEQILNELAWAFRMNRLQLWDEATVEGKRGLLKNIFAIRKKSGTKFAVRRVFDLMSVVGTIYEWWEPGEAHFHWAPFLYRIRIFVDEVGVTQEQITQVHELTYRFAPARTDVSEFAVESNRGATIYQGAALTIGRHVTIPFGGP